jgi:hypothetical protein
MKKKLILFLALSTIILGLVGFWYYQKNIYSKEVLKLEILGPRETSLGEEVEYIVKYQNNGDVRLENPTLIFEYPDYSIINSGEPLRREIGKEELGGDIYPGEERTITFKCRLLGKENEARIAKAAISYQPRNLNAWYESKTTFTTIIEKVPISFQFDFSSKVEPGKDLNVRLNYFSNVDFPLSGLRVKMSYPSGFDFKESNPGALGENEWEIGLLNRAEGGRIEAIGNIQGELGEEKIFKAELGSWKDGEFVLLKEISRGVEIIRPDIYITQQINGSPEYIASAGGLLHYEIIFKNLSQESLTNLFMVAQLQGSIIDLESIKAPGGSFETGNNSIVFDWRKNPQLAFLDSQEEGKIEFWVELKEDWKISDIDRDKNPIVKSQIILSEARREFETKVNSKLEVSQKAYFENEIFDNSGPIPPEVGRYTTYVITWQVKNYYNRVEDIKVRAFLPDEVELTGNIFPEEKEEDFVFDSGSREIIWNVNDLDPGEGVINSAPSISFQVRLMPSSSQRGEPALLISEVEISGEDQWTDQILISTAPSIDTTLPDDETISEEMGIVE